MHLLLGLNDVKHPPYKSLWMGCYCRKNNILYYYQPAVWTTACTVVKASDYLWSDLISLLYKCMHKVQHCFLLFVRTSLYLNTIPFTCSGLILPLTNTHMEHTICGCATLTVTNSPAAVQCCLHQKLSWMPSKCSVPGPLPFQTDPHGFPACAEILIF